MEILENLIDSGRIIDIAIAVMALELLVLIALDRMGRLKVNISGLIVNLGAGGSLAMAVRASLTESSYLVIAGWLVSALVFHMLDVSSRVRLRDGD